MIGGFFAIFTPPPEDSPESDPLYGLTLTDDGYDVTPRSALDHAYARTFTDAVVQRLNDLEIEADGKLSVVRSYRELILNFDAGVFSIVLHLEGAEAIDEELNNLQSYYAQGVRSLGLVWSRPNAFATGVPFRFPHSPDTGAGLTAAGTRLLRHCNELGIVVDLAHINEQGFWDVAALSAAPLVVSHAGVHALCPSTRNLTDRQLDAIGASNGVIGIIFEPLNLRADGQPQPDTPLNEIARHVDYVAQRIGIDHVALGSDFDGADMPSTLSDASKLPQLFHELEDWGYDRASMQKIAYGNWFRILRESWQD